MLGRGAPVGLPYDDGLRNNWHVFPARALARDMLKRLFGESYVEFAMVARLSLAQKVLSTAILYEAFLIDAAIMRG